ncbi:MAG: hypothetical protein GTN36_04300 [Candidatus Aenigmarchaeota archaeon]|nr:hypothetical protein [Candidatus Aenigmarchaeota archaeon]
MKLPKILPEHLVKTDIDIEDIPRTRFGRSGYELFRLAMRSVNLSKKYLHKFDDRLVFDFRNRYFHLWVIEGNEKPKREVSKEGCGTTPARVCVGANYIAASRGWFGEPVKIWEFSEGIPKIRYNDETMFPTLNSSVVTNYFKRRIGIDVFGYNKKRDTIKLTFVPRGIIPPQ